MIILKKKIQPIQGDPEFYRNISSDGCKRQERLHCSQGQGYRWQPGSQGLRIFRITLYTAWRGESTWLCTRTGILCCHLSGDCTCVVGEAVVSYFLDCSFVCMQHSRCGVCSFQVPKGFQGFSSRAGAFFGRAILPACPPLLIETRSLNWPWSLSTQLGGEVVKNWFHPANPGLPTHHQPQLVLECEIIHPALEVSF